MKKTLHYPIFNIVLVILLSGCHFNTNNTVHSTKYPITIDLDEAIRNKIKFKLSNIIDSITYIPIESMIGDYVTYLNGNRLKVSKSYIIAEGYRGRGDLVLFDRKGRFIRKVAQRGQGPGEYSRMSGIAIDEKHEIIYVLCTEQCKIFKYNLEGIFSGAIDLSDFVDVSQNIPVMIAVSPSGQILVNFPNWSGDLQFHCLLFDHQGNLVNRLKNYLFYTGEPNVLGFEGTYYIYKDQIHIKNLCDTLFVVENDRFQPKYVFKYGNNQSNHITHLEYKERITQFYGGNVFETDSKVFFSFRLNKRMGGYYGYYDKNEGKAYSSTDEFFNDMDAEKYSTFSFMSTDSQFNDEIIIFRGSEHFDRKILKEKVSSSKYLEITNMLDSIHSVDNDLVVVSIFHFKNKE